MLSTEMLRPHEINNRFSFQPLAISLKNSISTHPKILAISAFGSITSPEKWDKKGSLTSDVDCLAVTGTSFKSLKFIQGSKWEIYDSAPGIAAVGTTFQGRDIHMRVISQKRLVSVLDHLLEFEGNAEIQMGIDRLFEFGLVQREIIEATIVLGEIPSHEFLLQPDLKKSQRSVSKFDGLIVFNR